MLRKVDRDVKRFKEIVRGVIKKEFRKYLTQGELIGRQGKHIVSIPLPQVEIPRFRFGQREVGVVGRRDHLHGCAHRRGAERRGERLQVDDKLRR